MWSPASLHSSHFYSEHFWTYLGFFGLFPTQPANEPSPELKKQPKMQRTRTAQKTVN